MKKSKTQPQTTLEVPAEAQKHVPTNEMIIFLMGTFLYTNLVGMIGSYRQSYLIDVLHLHQNVTAIINGITSVVPFVLSFFLTMIIDRPPKPGKDKFRPLVMHWTIPLAILSILMFWTPSFISTAGDSFKTAYPIIIYCVLIQTAHAIANQFAGQLNSIAVVISPNNKERDDIISYRSIVNAIGNSAPLVVVLVAGAITDNVGLRYIGSSILCSVVGAIFMLWGAKITKERIAYNPKKVNPLMGFADVIKNKWALIILFSEFLKNFRRIASYMGIFLAAALLGDSDKYLFLGLPTGIGTFVGMMIVKALLNKFNSKQIYIASNFYSLFANLVAFGVGYAYFKTGAGYLQVLFVITLFLIGLQFGASNLLPDLFKADVLEDVELKTHKRLDATLGFVVGIGSSISGAIASVVSPLILYGDNSIIHYVQPEEGVYPEQSFKTKVLLLFFYTVFHGLMMLLGGLPFFFYKLTGEKKEEIHAQVLKYRETITEEDSDATDAPASSTNVEAVESDIES